MCLGIAHWDWACRACDSVDIISQNVIFAFQKPESWIIGYEEPDLEIAGSKKTTLDRFGHRGAPNGDVILYNTS